MRANGSVSRDDTLRNVHTQLLSCPGEKGGQTAWGELASGQIQHGENLPVVKYSMGRTCQKGGQVQQRENLPGHNNLQKVCFETPGNVY